MKIVRTKLMKLTGKKYMLLFCWLLTAPKAVISDVDINHEAIHSRQFVELMILFAVATVFIRWWLPLFSPLFFYVLYVVEYLIHLIRFKSTHIAYRRISFEREAYTHQGDMNYLSRRTWFSFLNYIG